MEVLFKFRNTGQEPLVLESVRAACPCTEISLWERVTAPGATGEIPVTFIAPRLNGQVTKVIFVKTNDAANLSLQLRLSGRVLIPIEVVPLNLWLGEVTGQTEVLEGSFTVRNNLAEPLYIAEVLPPDVKLEYELTGGKEGRSYRLEFRLLPPFTGEGTVTHSFRLLPAEKGSEEIRLQFHYFNSHTE